MPNPGKPAKHSRGELQQLQSLPLDAKLALTKERIRDWYEGWARVGIIHKRTKHHKYKCFDCRDPLAEPEIRKTEYIDSWTPGAVYVSFSGGKDSTVLKHIVDSMYKDVPAVFFNTGLEYPEIQRFVKDVQAGKWDCYNSDVDIVRPKMRFDEVIKHYGYPIITKEVASHIYDARRNAKIHNIPIEETHIYKKYFQENSSVFYNNACWKWLFDTDIPISGDCCDSMKKRPGHRYAKVHGRNPMLAMLAAESQTRKTKWLAEGCNAFDNEYPSSNPLSFWTEQDVLQYMKEYDVPYCKEIYGEIVPDGQLSGQLSLIDESRVKLKTTGANRTGCMFCMFGITHEKEPNRFQKMKITHPKQYEYCMKPVEEGGLGLAHVLDVLGVKY